MIASGYGERPFRTGRARTAAVAWTLDRLQERVQCCVTLDAKDSSYEFVVRGFQTGHFRHRITSTRLPKLPLGGVL